MDSRCASSHSSTASAPTIAACLAVQNSERVLASCLARLRPFVDEIVIADLASTDHSSVIACEYGARIVQLSAREPTSAIRHSCQQLTHAGWIVWIEVADLIPEHLAKQLKPLLEQQSPETHSVDFIINDPAAVNGANHTPRILQITRRSPGLPEDANVNGQLGIV